VPATLLRDDAKVVIDERMLDALPERFGENRVCAVEIARLERSDACRDLCLR
jgi:hypothetical protein